MILIFQKNFYKLFNREIFYMHFVPLQFFIYHFCCYIIFTQYKIIRIQTKVLLIDFLNLYFRCIQSKKYPHPKLDYNINFTSPFGENKFIIVKIKSEESSTFAQAAKWSQGSPRNRTEILSTIDSRLSIFEGDERKRKERGGDRWKKGENKARKRRENVERRKTI